MTVSVLLCESLYQQNDVFLVNRRPGVCNMVTRGMKTVLDKAYTG